MSSINKSLLKNTNLLEIIQQIDKTTPPHRIFLHPSNYFLPASGALAAYNMGTERMDYNNVDAHTTGGDYSADVLARAEYFERNGY